MKACRKVNVLIILLLVLGFAGAVQAAPDDRKADLTVSVSDSPDPVTAGNQLTYAITATNLGDPDPDRTSDAKKVEVTLALPAGVTYVSGPASNPACVEAAGTVTCNYAGNFAVGSRSFNVVVSVNPTTTGTIAMTASITSDFNHAVDPDLTNNSETEDTAVEASADLSILKSDDVDPVAPGGNIVYTLTAANAGPSAATTVVITDMLPAGTVFVSAPGCTYDSINHAVICGVTSIAPGSDASFSITVTAPGTPQLLTNNASVDAATNDTNNTNDGTSETTLVDTVPVADDQSVSVDEDGSLPITLTGSDGDNDSLTYALVDPPANGQLLGTPPDVTYEPDANYFGSDSFTFRVNDGLADSNLATISITVDPVNDAPVADDQTVNTTEDNSVGITATASDIENDALTWSVVAGPSNGVLTGDLPDVTYQPNANYNGTDSFTFQVNDGTDDSNIATITINVASAQDAPVSDSQSVSTDEDTNLSITATANDADNDPLTWILVSGPSNGTLIGDLPSVTYDPDDNYNGPDSFTFKVNDGNGDSNTATVSITVDPVNDAPEADNDSYNVNEDDTLTVAASGVLGNDSDVENDSLTAVLVMDVSNGTLSLNSDGSFDYTPDADFNGSDSFTYKANDGTDDGNTATVTINVDPVNDNPDAVDDSDSLDQDTSVTTDVLANDDDIDGDTLTVTGVTQGANGAVTNNNDGTVTYTPDAGFSGTDSYTYTISDGNGGTDTATVDITIVQVVDISIGDVTIDEPLSGSTVAHLTVTLSATPAQDVTVDFITQQNSATAGSDYTSTSGQLTIPAGQTTGTIDVTVLSDGTPFEGSETCFVNLSNPDNGNIVDGQGTLTIVDTCLFCDDFENSTLDSTNWTYTPTGGAWSEDGDNLVASATKKAVAIANGFGGCLNCTVDVTVQTAGGLKNKIWIFGWQLDKSNRMELLMKEETDVWLLKQRSGGSVVAKAKTKLFPIVPNVSYDVKIDFNGTQFSVTIDGTPAFTLNPSGSVQTGTVGFQVKATTGKFGQIIVN